MARRTNHHFNWFERGWNSTLGVPEQVIRRLWRVGQGDADLFSRDGLFDASLIPIIGAFDQDRGDVSDEEFMGRINQTFGTELDPDNIAHAIGVGIFTDPLSFLTGGATAVAKAGRATRTVALNSAVQRTGRKVGANATLREVLETVDDARKVATPSEARALSRAAKDLRSGGDLDAKVLDLQMKETEKQLMVAVPFLERFQSAQFARLDSKHKSWWTLANQGAGKGLAAAGVVGKPLAKIPGIDLVVKQLAQVGHGYNLSKKSQGSRIAVDFASGFSNPERGVQVAEELHRVEPLHAQIKDRGGDIAVTQEFDELLDTQALRNAADATDDTALAKKLRARATRLEKMSPAAKFLKAMGETVPKKAEDIQRKAENIWSTMGKGNQPLPQTADELFDALRPFMDDTQGLIDEATTSVVRQVQTASFDALSEAEDLGALGKTAFKLFNGMRKTRNKWFKTDFESGDTTFKASEDIQRKDVARMTTAVRERSEVLFRAIKDAADESGMPPEQFDSLISATMEASALGDELEELAVLAASDPGKYAKSVENFFNRAQGALTTVEQIFKAYGLEDVAAQVHNIGLKGILDEGVAAVLKPTASRKVIGETTRPLKWPLPAGHKIGAGKYQGDYLGYLSNKELNEALTDSFHAARDQIDALERKLMKAPINEKAAIRKQIEELKAGGTVDVPEEVVPDSPTGALVEVTPTAEQLEKGLDSPSAKWVDASQGELGSKYSPRVPVEQGVQNSWASARILSRLDGEAPPEVAIVVDPIDTHSWNDFAGWFGQDLLDRFEAQNLGALNKAQSNITEKIKDLYGIDLDVNNMPHSFNELREMFPKAFKGLDDLRASQQFTYEMLDIAGDAGKWVAIDASPQKALRPNSAAAALRSKMEEVTPIAVDTRSGETGEVLVGGIVVARKELITDDLRALADEMGTKIHVDEGGELVETYAGKATTKQVQRAAPRAAREGVGLSDARAINQLLDLRRAGKAKKVARPSKFKQRSAAPEFREPTALGSADEALELAEGAADHLDDDYLTGLGRTTAKLAAHTHEMQRVMRAGHDVPAEVIQGVTDGLAGFSELVEQTVRRGLGEQGNKVFDYMRETQREILRAAVEAGELAAGSPIAYLPRILSNSSRNVLRQIIGDIPADVRASLAPQLSGVFKRNLDQYSLGEINSMAVELEKVAPNADYTLKLREFAQKQGIEIKQYTDSAGEALLTRFAQAQQSKTSADFIDNVIGEIGNAGSRPMVGAQVVGFVNLQGQKRVFSQRSKAARTTALDPTGDVTMLRNEMVDEAENIRGVVIRDGSGKEAVLDLHTIGNGMAMLPVGATDGTVGQAFAATAARGKGLQNLIEAGRSIGVNEMAELVGQQVLFGDKALVGGLVKHVTDQYKHTSGFWAGYDAVHGVVKTLQTVARPDFHVANFVSSMFQMAMTPGVGPRAMTGAFMDTMRLLFNEDELVSQFDAAGRMLGSDGIGRLEFARAVKRQGVLGTADIAEATFNSGDMVYSLDEMFKAMDEEGLLGTFTSEGLRGSSTVSNTLSTAREAAFAGKGKVKDKLRNGAEASELVVRMMSVFAHVRAGYSPATAAKMTNKAMVNYAANTKFENSVMKRAFSFYTFPRHYIPEAWRQFNQDPRKLSTLANSFQGLETAGVLSTQDGRATLKLPNDFALNMGRMHAGVDAMMMLPGLLASADIFVGDDIAELEGAPGIPEASSFFQLGALANLGFEMFDQDYAGDATWFEELASTTAVTRFLQVRLQGGNPDIERSLSEEVLEQLMPVSKRAPKHSQKVLRGRFMALQRDLIGRLEDAAARNDRETVDELRDDLRELTRTMQKMR